MASTAILWSRGKDLMILSYAWGQVAAGTGVVTFPGGVLSGQLQNTGLGPSGITFPSGTTSLSTTAIRGNCDGLRIACRYMLDQIIALDANTDNFTEILQSSDVSLGEVMIQGYSGLAYGYHQGVAMNTAPCPYIQVVAAIGNAVHFRGYLLTMQRESLGDGTANFGKNMIELGVKPADLGYGCVQYFQSS